MKSWAMKLPSRNVILFNGAAVLFMAGAAGYGIRSALFKEDIVRCSERANYAVRMSLERDGSNMHASELQAAMGATDWNLLDNARVVGLKAGPSPRALEFKTVLTKASAGADAEQRPGVGFVWSPKTVNTNPSTCLSYSVFVPDTFDFGGGGRLPGLVGGGQSGSKDAAGSISTRLVWNEQGKLDLLLRPAGSEHARVVGGNRSGTTLKRGEWVNFEQELVLNNEGAADGALRLWVDGKLVIEHGKLTVRSSGATLVSGVVSEVTVLAKRQEALKPSIVWVSPFELRW